MRRGSSAAERIAAERADWQQRARDAASRVTDLEARCAEAAAEHAALEAAPAQIAARRAEAVDALEAAERQRIGAPRRR